MDQLSEDGCSSPDLNYEKEVVMHELEITKDGVKEMIHTLDDMRHNFKIETEQISQKLRERSEVYTNLEKKLSILPEIYGREIEDIVALQQQNKERIYYQNNDRLIQITERLRMLDTKVSGIEIQKERDDDNGDVDMIKSRDLVIKSVSGLIHLLILIFHAFFFLLSIPSEMLKPLTRSTTRMITSSVIFVLISVIYIFLDELVLLGEAKLKGVIS